jgi:uncharacterized protein (UPF0303 family)
MVENTSLAHLLKQEQHLQFAIFDNVTAWQLGCELKILAEKQQAQVAIEVYAFNQRLFSYAMAGTTPDNLLWIKRKRQSVLRFGHSTYYLNQYNASKNRTFEDQNHINPHEYCAHGGAFPIRIKNNGLIGVVTVSGLPQEEDHKMVTEVLAKLTQAKR